MCGINGVLQTGIERVVNHQLLVNMNNAISHRGPDESGVYTEEFIGLGHVRLSILDLKSGHQPWVDKSGRVSLVFNGEIYNYRDIRDELEKDGYKFTTNCDTEVIPYCYMKYGDKFASRLNGMFAIALWDSREKKLILVRDRLGKKPMYYASFNGGLVFSSEIQGLLASDCINKSISLSAIDAYLSLGFVPNSECVFSEIKKLPPACFMVIGNDGTQNIIKYWKLDKNKSIDLTFEEVVINLDEKLEQAVKRRLYSDVPLGCFLSGGVDSTLIASYVAKNSMHPIDTYCIGFNEKKFDERDAAKEVAIHLGTHHHEDIIKVDSLEALPILQKNHGEPFGDASAIPTYFLCKAVKKDLTVAIGGDGGDELFLGYTAYKRLMRRQQLSKYTNNPPVASLLNFVSKRIKRNIKSPLYRAWNTVLESTYPLEKQFSLLRNPFNQRERHDLYKPTVSESLSSSDPAMERIELLFREVGDLSALTAAGRVDHELYMVDDILAKVDIASMATSLEVRAPLLDYKLVEFAASLPDNYKYKNGKGKILLKELAKMYLPSSILNRPKQGFGVPISDWLRNDLADYSREILLNNDGFLSTLFDLGLIKNMLQEHIDGKNDHGNKLWLLLCLAVWSGEYGLDKTTPYT